MTRITWGSLGQKKYGAGLDRGVLYTPDGVPWNGLRSVDEDFSEDTTEPYYFDGNKYVDYQSYGDFSASLKAFAYPLEFEPFDGFLSLDSGLSVDCQPAGTFGMSYRTLKGDGLVGLDLGYEIHLLYNLTAVPSARTRETVGAETSAAEFEWTISGIPEPLAGFRPTVHAILDSVEMGSRIISDLEDILYGSDSTTARLPSLTELSSIIDGLGSIVIIDNGDGTWTAIGPDELFSMLDYRTFQITEANATYLDANTYEISNS